MFNIHKTAAVAALIVTVAGCGGTTTTTFIDNTPSFSRELSAFSVASTAARSAPVSDVTGMVSAAGTYSGTAQLSVLGSGATPSFLGDANLTADFGAGRVSGNLSNFRGGLNLSNPETLQGSIKVAGQTIGAPSVSRFTSGLAGTLTGPQTSIVLGTGAVLSGDFRNSPADSLFASGTANGTTLNGVTGRAAVLNVVAEKQ